MEVEEIPVPAKKAEEGQQQQQQMSEEEKAEKKRQAEAQLKVVAKAVSAKKRNAAEFAALLEARTPVATGLAREGRLREAIDMLLPLEKQFRQAEDPAATSKVCVLIVSLCWEARDLQALAETAALLSKRRGQLKTAVQDVVQRCMAYADELERAGWWGTGGGATREALLRALRNITEGKIYVEVERARLTRQLAAMREAAGDAREACRLMQDVQVETFGSMGVADKTDFILEQMRLCLDTDDTARAFILSKKVSRQLLARPEHEALRLRFCELMVRYWHSERYWLEVATSYNMAYNTPSVLADPAARTRHLRDIVVHTILAPFGEAQADLCARTLADRHIEEVPQWRALLELFSTPELIRWTADIEGVYAAALAEVSPFAGTRPDTPGESAWRDLRMRVVEHNVRVTAKYYTRITVTRLAQLLELSPADAERAVAEQVVGTATPQTARIYARIDRPAGIVRFGKPSDAAVLLDGWARQIGDLVALVDDTCQLINHEQISHSKHGQQTAPAAVPMAL